MVNNILVINPNPNEAEGIRSRMTSPTTNVICVHSAGAALDCFERYYFCLVILDAEVSLQDDHKVLKAMTSLQTMPILLLSSNSDHTERLNALRAGAHAYMGKPYTEDEWLLQAQLLMQIYLNSHPQSKGLCYTLAFGKDLVIEPNARQVYLGGETLNIRRKEYDLLFTLASNPGKVFSFEELYDHIWDDSTAYNVEEVVKYHIKSLRKKLSGTSAEYIKNVWGVGYRFDDYQIARR